MRLLSIETSCDETALAILEIDNQASQSQATELNLEKLEIQVIDSAINSQIEIHKKYGGVYPSLAKREHAKNLIPLFEKINGNASSLDVKKNFTAESTSTRPEIRTEIDTEPKMQKCKEILEREPELFAMFKEYIPKINKPDFDMITVTNGPGLEPALWVGINFARALSYYFDIPMLPINHMEGHIFSVLKNSTGLQFPAIALLISGGHTELILIKKIGDYEIVGQTRDDAVGEAFDKVARIMSLPYPGGPEISKLAELARQKNLQPDFVLPRPMISTKELDFSFSGLKTAVLYLVKKIKENSGSNELDSETKEKIALEFENAVTEVLINKTEKALKKYSAKNLIIGGGVISNIHIRKSFDKISTVSNPTISDSDISDSSISDSAISVSTGSFLGEKNLKIFLPPKELATDNAVMIGIAGFIKSTYTRPEICPEIVATGNLRLK
ncbi:MAG TPA: tRNA (adenosine(37)-N6)-threonylcarbamoyltransferase complex transferase subunit TsaD [Candidatus Paceibacterota bacterium]|nr:tRNA (adenosine(37)-N6)-threonylcarbamoyltransferase complex transferase subunit TsaD [Candidatus Paceibacterota bacterium]